MLKIMFLLLALAPAFGQVTNPTYYEIIDDRFTNYTGPVVFTWTPNKEPDLAGYNLYWGPSNRFYTNHAVIGLTNKGRLNVSLTNRNYFGLTAFNEAGLESPPATNELVYPLSPMPYYSNYVVLIPYRFATNLDGPWLTYTARLHYVSQTNGPLFWQSLPLQIQKAP